MEIGGRRPPPVVAPGPEAVQAVMGIATVVRLADAELDPVAVEWWARRLFGGDVAEDLWPQMSGYTQEWYRSQGRRILRVRLAYDEPGIPSPYVPDEREEP